MSLINDALKRASTQSKSPISAPSAPALATLQPVPDSGRASGPLPIVLCIVGVGALLMAGAFWLKAKGSASSETQQIASVQTPTTLAHTALTLSTLPAPTAPAATATSASTPVAVTQNPVQQAAATLQKVAERNETSQTLSHPAPSLTAAVPDIPLDIPQSGNRGIAASTEPAFSPVESVVPAPAPAPTFRLQAVYFRMKGPTVVLNGKTLGIGDSVDGARLVGIERTSAEILFRGKIQKLTMH